MRAHTDTKCKRQKRNLREKLHIAEVREGELVAIPRIAEHIAAEADGDDDDQIHVNEKRSKAAYLQIADPVNRISMLALDIARSAFEPYKVR